MGSRESLLPDPAHAPPVLHVADIARLLGVTAKTVANWSRRGLLPRFVAIGPRTRVIRTEELRQALRALDNERGSDGGEENSDQTPGPEATVAPKRKRRRSAG